MKKQEKHLYISAGKGPAECEWVVMKLYDLISKCLVEIGFRFEVINTTGGRYDGTYKSIQINLKGADVERHLSPWIGTIQWIGKSIYRPKHKRINWFVRVDLLDIQCKVSIKENDLEYLTYKASGPGGQHRNKVESAVKVIHRPSGLGAICSDSRSQHQNKVIARKRLFNRIEEISHSSKLGMSSTKNQLNNLLVRGNPIKIFKGYKFNES